MAQPMRWLWGLAPLALLWAIANVALDDMIQNDVGQRAIASAAKVAGEAPGARPLLARVAGRDVTIAGEALSSDGAARAMAQLRSEFGVRRALGGLTQVVAQKPYSWSASRLGQVVTLSGSVPDEVAAAANAAAAAAAVPGARIDDRQSLAFGAPEGFAALTTAMLPELGKLASGKLAIDDGRFCVEGGAASPEALPASREAVKQLAKGGFQAVDCSLDPPTVAPYRWAVERAGERVSVSGFYPSDATRQQVAGLLRRVFPEPIAIDDRTLPALGAPAAFLAKVTRAVDELARLQGGRAAIDGDVYTIAGQGPDGFEACQALRLQIAQLDGPDSVAQANIACPPAPPPLPPLPALPDIPEPVFLPADLAPASPAPPPVSSAAAGPPAAPAPTIAAPPAAPPVVALRWQATKGPDGLAVSGFAPDDAAKAAVAQAVVELAHSGAFDDRSTIEPHLAPRPDFAATTRFALTLLGPMSRGTATLDGAILSLGGEVSDSAGWTTLQAALAQLPAGLSLRIDTASLAIRPYQLGISADKSGVQLTGYLPDAAARAALLTTIEASQLRGKTVDSTALLPSVPAGFVEAAQLALVNLLRLDLGSASIDEGGALIQGLTCRDLIKSEVETSVAQARASGLKIEAGVELRQTGCVIDPPNTCQNDLDALTKRNTVLFGQGVAAVVLDTTTERVVGEAFDILKQCPASRITIEGHANRDGEARGFNNRDLSERRAFRVRDELVKRGVDPAQLAVTGFGSERPLVPHGAVEAKATNRRVQFTVSK